MTKIVSKTKTTNILSLEIEYNAGDESIVASELRELAKLVEDNCTCGTIVAKGGDISGYWDTRRE